MYPVSRAGTSASGGLRAPQAHSHLLACAVLVDIQPRRFLVLGSWFLVLKEDRRTSAGYLLPSREGTGCLRKLRTRAARLTD
jgi:hypothetical protein